MLLQAMGDTAWLATKEGEVTPASLARVRALAADLESDRPAGVTDVVPAYNSVAVHYAPEDVATEHGEAPWRVVAEWIERHLGGKAPAAAKARRAGRAHVVPVCYGGEHGPDLAAVAKTAKLSPEAAAALHASVDYQVAAVGFTPGFPYLFGLPEKLVAPRRATPRLRVPAGSVGIGGAQTGVYPRETPGGWNLIGRTAAELFDPARAERPALFAPGDTVRFRAVADLAEAAKKSERARTNPAGRSGFEVLKPGTLTTVQDLGRAGLGSMGVGRGGALDVWAAMTANLAVGNAPDAPVLECTYVGPVLRFIGPAIVAGCGAESAGLSAGRPVAVKAGDVIDCSALTRGARLYLAVAGGVRAPLVLGSASTAVGAGFGGLEGRALRAGDRLTVGGGLEEKRVPGPWRLASPVPPPAKKDVIEIRLVPGPDWARIFKRMGSPAGAVRAVESRRFQLSAKSDRMGLRLQGEPFTAPGGGDGWSRPVVPGTVQLPPDGQPIVLIGEGQTIGGYPQLGQVASVDLAKLAQARPGAEIVFRVVDITAAQQARVHLARDLARLRTGLELRR